MTIAAGAGVGLRGRRIVACILWCLLVGACGGMPPEQELRVLGPEEAGARGGDVATQGSAVTLVMLARQHEAWLQAFLDEVKDRAAHGKATTTDIAQVESRLAAATARRAALEGDLAASCARYKESIGQPAPGCLP